MILYMQRHSNIVQIGYSQYMTQKRMSLLGKKRKVTDTKKEIIRACEANTKKLAFANRHNRLDFLILNIHNHAILSQKRIANFKMIP